jgi:phage terminase large subunit
MLSFNIHITKQSTNLIKEFRNYTWVKDKEGKATGKPVDMYNHGIDAVRYAIQTKTAKNFVL